MNNKIWIYAAIGKLVIYFTSSIVSIIAILAVCEYCLAY